MNPMPQLEPMLKQLRLSGILDSLAARNQQAIQSQIAYTDFLSLLIQDEVARRDQRHFTQRLRKAQVSGDKTLEKFDYAHSPSVNHALIAELATCRFITEYAPVLIVGPTGTGKSHLVQAICHCALRAGHDVLFITHNRLLASLHAAKATNSYERKLEQLAKIDVIAIDDFGLRPMRSPQDEDFHELISERYEKKTTLVTSNLAFDEWGAAFPNKLMGAATIDRLRDGAYQIELDGDTRRKPRPAPALSNASEQAANTASKKEITRPQ